MTFRRSERIHLVAICGTGMASLAGLLKLKGYTVKGSDQNIYPPMSDLLKNLKIPVESGFDPRHLEPAPDFAIIGNAVSKSNPEVQKILEKKIPYDSMPGALERFFLKEKLPIVVAGTHGKTTTAGLASWMLEQLGESPGFLVGGILKNWDRSFQLGSGRYFVVEGDEYDSAFFDKEAKFLHYHPEILILNPVEFDHADIYRDLPHLLSSFQKLLESMSPAARVIAHHQNENVKILRAFCRSEPITFGLHPEATIRAEGVHLETETRFQLIYRNKAQGEVVSPLWGRHNIENSLGVLTLLLEWGKPLPQILEALRNFQGMKRRQEVVSQSNRLILDDFAHHPTAIRETLRAVRDRFPSRRLWAIFEPRSNTTRRNVFQQEFPHSFDPADEVLMAPVYLPEKIPESERLQPELVVKELKKVGKKARLLNYSEILETLVSESREGDIFCFMSNGSFGGIIPEVIQRLQTD